MSKSKNRRGKPGGGGPTVKDSRVRGFYARNVGGRYGYRDLMLLCHAVSFILVVVAGFFTAGLVANGLARFIKAVAVRTVLDEKTGLLTSDTSRGVFDVGMWSAQTSVITTVTVLFFLYVLRWLFVWVRDIMSYSTVMAMEHKREHHGERGPRKTVSRWWRKHREEPEAGGKDAGGTP